MKRLVMKAYHFIQRILHELKRFPGQKKNFGFEVARETFIDGLIPPGKSERYIKTIEDFVDDYIGHSLFSKKYEIWNASPAFKEHYNVSPVLEQGQKVPVWCCWWQGEDSMPELVRMCQERLKQIIPEDRAKLYMITLENYLQFAEIPNHIVRLFQLQKISMTEMSDILRMALLSKHGGLWVDATLFFTGGLPDNFLKQELFCQKMYDPIECRREACKGRWCGFLMSGSSENPIFHFVKDAFCDWWKHYDRVIDYVLIDYFILAGYKKFTYMKQLIDHVPNNNEDIFKMYRVLNEPYTPELYESLTHLNVVHKLTYKMQLFKVTKEGKLTLYGYLLKSVFGEECEE